MKPSQFFLLATLILTAPNHPAWFAALAGISCLIVAVVFAIRGD